MSYRAWCLTINNWTDEHLQLFTDLYESGKILYGIAGREVGESGTPHLQCTVFFARTHRRPAVRRMFPGAHVSVCKFREKSVTYCKKENSFTEFGTTETAQGERTDLSIAIDTLRKDGLQALKLEHPVIYVKYPRGISTLLEAPPRDPSKPPIVTWLHGPTGTGKTRSVVAWEKDLWISGGSLRWWDGYTGQEAVLFDDFRGDFCTFHWFLRVVDRYPIRVELKGTSREFTSSRIYITCPDHPQDVWPSHEDKRQLLRRINRIILVDDESQPLINFSP